MDWNSVWWVKTFHQITAALRWRVSLFNSNSFIQFKSPINYQYLQICHLTWMLYLDLLRTAVIIKTPQDSRYVHTECPSNTLSTLKTYTIYNSTMGCQPKEDGFLSRFSEWFWIWIYIQISVKLSLQPTVCCWPLCVVLKFRLHMFSNIVVEFNIILILEISVCLLVSSTKLQSEKN